MRPTTGYRRGDVVLVHFIFSEETGVKKRPALVVSTDAYQKGRQEAIVAAITSNLGRRLIGDTPVSDWKGAGLLYPSQVSMVIRTVKQPMIARQLGRLEKTDLDSVEKNLRIVLGL